MNALLSFSTSLGWAALVWTLPCALAAIVLACTRRHPASAARTVWTWLLAGLCLLPLTQGWLPSWWTASAPAAAVAEARVQATESAAASVHDGMALSRTALPASAAAVSPGSIPVTATPSRNVDVAWPQAAAIAWLAGALLLAVRRLRAHRRLLVELRASRPADAGLEAVAQGVAADLGLGGRWRLRFADDAATPFVAGLWRPTLVLPADAPRWPAGRLRSALRHELLHLRPGALWRRARAQWAGIVFFFHPAVWLAAAALRRATERACDDAVVAAGAPRHDYAADLLAIARQVRRGGAVGALAMARPGALEERLRALLDDGRRRQLPRGLQTTLAVAAALLVLVAGGLRPGVIEAREWLRRDAGYYQLECEPAAAGGLCANGQRKARALLEKAGQSGAVVVQDVATGEIAVYAERSEDAVAVPLIPPASVAKLALAAMWWDAGLPDTTKPCRPSWRSRHGLEIRTFGGYDRESIAVPAQMLVLSCNTAAGAMAEDLFDRMGAAAIRGRLAELGFGDVAPSEERLPDAGFWGAEDLPAPPRPFAGQAEASFERDWPSIASGSGDMATTPLHVASLLQAIGNGGVQLPPRPLGFRAGGGAGKALIQPRTAERLRAALTQVVHEGTGRRIEPQLEFSSWQLGGKTGTAGGVHEGGWFAGLATDGAGKPRYAVVVYVEGAGGGGGKPAGIAAEMTRFLARQAGDEL